MRYASSALAEFAVEFAPIQTAVTLDVEDHLLSVGVEEQLLAVDLVGNSNLLRHHAQGNRIARPKFELVHHKAIAQTGALRNICATEVACPAASGQSKAGQDGCDAHSGEQFDSRNWCHFILQDFYHSAERQWMNVTR